MADKSFSIQFLPDSRALERAIQDIDRALSDISSTANDAINLEANGAQSAAQSIKKVGDESEDTSRDVSDLASQLSSLSGGSLDLQGTVDSLSESFGGAGAGLTTLVGSMARGGAAAAAMANPVGAAVVAIAALGAAGISAANNLGTLVQQFENVSAQTGSSPEELKDLRDILNQLGAQTDLRDIGDELADLEDRLRDLDDPSSEAAQALEDVGISAQDIEADSTTESLLNLIEATNDLTDAEQRRVLQQTTSEEGFRQFAALTRLSEEQLQEFRRELGRTSNITDEQRGELIALSQENQEFSQTLRDVGQAIAADFAGSGRQFTAILNDMLDIVGPIARGISVLVSELVEFSLWIIRNVNIISRLADLFERIDNATSFGDFFSGGSMTLEVQEVPEEDADGPFKRRGFDTTPPSAYEEDFFGDGVLDFFNQIFIRAPKAVFGDRDAILTYNADLLRAIELNEALNEREQNSPILNAALQQFGFIEEEFKDLNEQFAEAGADEFSLINKELNEQIDKIKELQSLGLISDDESINRQTNAFRNAVNEIIDTRNDINESEVDPMLFDELIRMSNEAVQIYVDNINELKETNESLDLSTIEGVQPESFSLPPIQQQQMQPFNNAGAFEDMFAGMTKRFEDGLTPLTTYREQLNQLKSAVESSNIPFERKKMLLQEITTELQDSSIAFNLLSDSVENAASNFASSITGGLRNAVASLFKTRDQISQAQLLDLRQQERQLRQSLANRQITQREFNIRMQEINANGTEAMAEQWQNLGDAITSIFENVGTFVLDIIDQIIQELITAITKALTLKAINAGLGLFGVGLPGIGDSSIGDLFTGFFSQTAPTQSINVNIQGQSRISGKNIQTTYDKQARIRRRLQGS